MSTPTRTRRLAALAALLLTAGVLVPLISAPTATAVEPTTTSRLEGNNRFGTAAAVALAAYPDAAEVDTVVLAVGIKGPDQPPAFADALSASGIAGALDAPLLLTGVDALPDPTVDALNTLQPDNVVLIGGTGAISTGVQTALEDAGYTVTRHAGDNRFGTAAAVGQAIADTDDGNPLTEGDGLGSTDDGVTAIITDGLNFPDAVSASQLAFAGRFPILLTGTDALPDPTSQALDDLGIEHALIIGGPNAVSEGVVGAIEQKDITTARLAGTQASGRFGTSVAVVEFAAANLDFGGDTIYLATGLDFPDALGGGIISGKNLSPLLLTGPTATPSSISDYIEANASAIDNIVALGGTGAISASSLNSAASAAVLDSAQVFSFTPARNLSAPTSSSGLNNDGRLPGAADEDNDVFTVSGIEPDTDVVIAVLDQEVVFNNGNNITAYDLSDEGTTSIESVSGSPNFPAGSGNEAVEATATADENGEITFAVDATEPDSVNVVVYVDVDGDGELGLAGSSPFEPYGVSGQLSWLPDQAAAGTYTATVTTVDRQQNFFFGSHGTPSSTDAFFYDSGDEFFIGALKINGITQFENLLSARDEIIIDYDPEGASRFEVDIDDIPDVTGESAAVVSNGLVRVSWTASEQPDVIYRVVRIGSDNDPNTADTRTTIEESTTSTTVQDGDTDAERTALAGFTSVRYEIISVGATSGQVDDTNDDGSTDGDVDELNNFTPFITNGVKPTVEFFLYDNGVAVDRNPGAAGVSIGDSWLFHFSRAITVKSPTIVVQFDDDPDDAVGPISVTVSSSHASFTVLDGTTLLVVLTDVVTGDAEGDAPVDITAYGANTEVMDINGVSNGDDQLSEGDSTEFHVEALEDDGPELMQYSSTCVPGNARCDISFNEPVDLGSAESTNSYTFNPGPDLNALTGVTLSGNDRTITVTFDNSLHGDATLDPGNGTTGVDDDRPGEDTADQDPVDLTVTGTP